MLARGIALQAQVIITTSLLVMIAYLATFDAISPMSREVAELLAPEISSGRLVMLDLAGPINVSAYHLVTRKDAIPSPLALRLHELVLTSLQVSIP